MKKRILCNDCYDHNHGCFGSGRKDGKGNEWCLEDNQEMIKEDIIRRLFKGEKNFTEAEQKIIDKERPKIKESIDELEKFLNNLGE